MILFRLNRLFIPEVKALNDAVIANKAAAARCKEKVMGIMEEATAGTSVILALRVSLFIEREVPLLKKSRGARASVPM